MRIKGFLIDLDGVLTKDENFSPINGAIEFISYLKKENIPFVIATSNSRYPPEEIVKKMQKHGFEIDSSDIVSPLVVAPEVLKKEDMKTLFILGSDAVKKFFVEKSFKVIDDYHVDAVLVGLDKSLNFQKIKIVTTALKREKAKLYALNKNIISKDDDGLLFPGVGTVAKMFATACQCNENFKHFGKGGEEYNKVIFEKIGIEPENLSIISDDIFVDLGGYQKLGLKTIFVTTGKYTVEDIPEDIKIDLVVNSLTELIGRIEFID